MCRVCVPAAGLSQHPDVQHPPPCLLTKSVSATAAKYHSRIQSPGTWPCPDDAISAQARLIKWQLSSSWHWGPVGLGSGSGQREKEKEPPHAAVIEFFQSSNKCLWRHRIFHFLAISIKTAGAASPSHQRQGRSRSVSNPPAQHIPSPSPIRIRISHFETLRPS